MRIQKRTRISNFFFFVLEVKIGRFGGVFKWGSGLGRIFLGAVGLECGQWFPRE